MLAINKGWPLAALLMSWAALSGKADTGCSRCTIEVLFQGVYTDETCVVSINGGSNIETVTLPTLAVSALSSAGDEAGAKDFAIALKDCPADRKVSVTFISNLAQADAATGNLVNASGENYSKNVQIRLRKEDGSQIAIDNAESGQEYFIPATGEEVSHDYSAGYYAKTSGVTAGSVKAVAGIQLVYK
ncbi:fimbrial protein [Kalamiella sp. sgz302252]|uniref:fimbrial protein n=1 Tax=Pantoea sp. sgz302252 TaxID=3341827 RepID=UPI0036D3B890